MYSLRIGMSRYVAYITRRIDKNPREEKMEYHCAYVLRPSAE